MNARRSGPRATFAAPSKLWTSSATRPEPKSSQTAQRNYERYLALARAEAQIGNMVGAENYYGVRSTGTYQVLAREAPRVQRLHTGSSKNLRVWAKTDAGMVASIDSVLLILRRKP